MTTQQTFGTILVGDFFDFIGPDRMLNSFYKRCEKISTRKYRDEDGAEHTIGSFSAKVYHVNCRDLSSFRERFVAT